LVAQKTQIVLKRMGQHHLPIRVAFTQSNGDGLSIEIDVPHAKPTELAVSQPGCVHNADR
jgi:hypothetical protein